MRIWIIAALLLPSTVGAAAYDRAAVRAHCEKEWDTDFEMVKYCVDNQEQAGAELDQLGSAFPTGTQGGDILKFCAAKWEDDLEMSHYCAKNQFDAAAWVASYAPDDVPSDIRDVILQQCTAKWEQDFEMVQYCAKNQTEAWLDLQ